MQNVLSQSNNEVRYLSNPNTTAGVLSQQPTVAAGTQQAQTRLFWLKRRTFANAEIHQDHGTESRLFYKEMAILVLIGLLVLLREFYL
mgnify:CR=1 FL=1